MKTEPNEPINTVHYVTKGREDKYGLTKREYFAAMAMQGMMANSAISDPFKYVAQNSIIMADELIEELNSYSK
jgi:hypothetical protein